MATTQCIEQSPFSIAIVYSPIIIALYPMLSTPCLDHSLAGGFAVPTSQQYAPSILSFQKFASITESSFFFWGVILGAILCF